MVEMMDDNRQTSGFGLRPRFSLLNLLVMVSVMGLLLLVIQQWREVEPLRQEVRRLRTELGYLVIEDPTKVYAIRAQSIEAIEPNTWRWRLYLPPGGKYSLNVFSGHISGLVRQPQMKQFEAAKRDGLGKLSSRKLEAGELKLDIKLVAEGEQWILETVPGGSHRIPQAYAEWLSLRRDAMAIFGVSQEQKVFENGQPVMLMYIPRPRFTTNSAGRSVTNLPSRDTDAIVVWLEQQPGIENN
jgi:hypothetical protein